MWEALWNRAAPRRKPRVDQSTILIITPHTPTQSPVGRPTNHTPTLPYTHNHKTNQVEAPKRLVELTALALEQGFFSAQLLKVVVRAEVSELLF